MKKQLIQLGFFAFSLATTVEARCFNYVSSQPLLRRIATPDFSRGFQPTEAQPRFPRRVATLDVSASQPNAQYANHLFARLETSDNEMLQASLRDAGAVTLRFRGLKPTAKVSRRSATKMRQLSWEGGGAPDAVQGAVATWFSAMDVTPITRSLSLPVPHRVHLVITRSLPLSVLHRTSLSNTSPLLQIALKTPELYSQCAQSLKDAASSNAALVALKAPSAKKRMAAADALAKSCEARAIEPLLAALKEDKDAEVRLAAAAALGQLGSVESVDPMIEALSDTDARVRAQLGHSLGSFTVHRARNAVLNVLVNPGGAEIKDAADLRARCLGILVVNQMIDVRFSRKAIGFLFGFLDHQDPQLKAIAEATAVELQHTRNGLRELMGIIKVHNYPPFRRQAVDWLGRWGDPEARDLLTETAANDRDASVKAAASEALKHLK